MGTLGSAFEQAFGIADTTNPLGSKAEKQDPSKFQDVRKLLGLKEQTRNGFRSALKNFDPSVSQWRECLSIVDEELGQLSVLLSRPRWRRVQYYPQFDYFRDPQTDIGHLNEEFYHYDGDLELSEVNYRLSRNRRFEGEVDPSEELLLRNPEPGEEPLYRNFRNESVWNAYRRFYAPWIAAFLYEAAVRAKYGMGTDGVPAEFISRLMSRRRVYVSGNRISEIVNELNFFSRIAYYAILEPREYARRVPLMGQLRDTLDILWKQRSWLERAPSSISPFALLKLGEGGVPRSILDSVGPLMSQPLRKRGDWSTMDGHYDVLIQHLKERGTDDEVSKQCHWLILRLPDVERVMSQALSRARRYGAFMNTSDEDLYLAMRHECFERSVQSYQSEKGRFTHWLTFCLDRHLNGRDFVRALRTGRPPQRRGTKQTTQLRSPRVLIATPAWYTALLTNKEHSEHKRRLLAIASAQKQFTRGEQQIQDEILKVFKEPRRNPRLPDENLDAILARRTGRSLETVRKLRSNIGRCIQEAIESTKI